MGQAPTTDKQCFKHLMLMLWNAYLMLLLPSGLLFVVPMVMSAYHAYHALKLILKVGVVANKG
jgi:hypothetical protein